MNIFKNKYFIGTALMVSAFMMNISNPVQAASQTECAIWLCAPGGFPSPSCNAAHSAMVKRILHGKSPLPALTSCTKDGNTGNTTSKTDKVIHIGKHYDTSYDRFGNDGLGKNSRAKLIPEHWEEKSTCWVSVRRGDYELRKFCTGPYYRIRVFVDQKQVGESYYWKL